MTVLFLYYSIIGDAKSTAKLDLLRNLNDFETTSCDHVQTILTTTNLIQPILIQKITTLVPNVCFNNFADHFERTAIITKTVDKKSKATKLFTFGKCFITLDTWSPSNIPVYIGMKSGNFISTCPNKLKV